MAGRASPREGIPLKPRPAVPLLCPAATLGHLILPSTLSICNVSSVAHVQHCQEAFQVCPLQAPPCQTFQDKQVPSGGLPS